jgi:myo-inositol-1(or 4)-monophosphatase
MEIGIIAGGQAEAAVIAHETYQDLAATRVIVEAAGAKFYRMNGDGFFLNEYLDGKRMEEHLLVVAPESLTRIRDCLHPVS